MAFHKLNSRLREAIGGRSLREIEELTNSSHETVRRYVQGHSAPSAEFIAALCTALKINAEWMLMGHGPMFRHEIRGATINDASATELLTTLAKTIEKLIERVERLEQYTMTLETRLRGSMPTVKAAGQRSHSSSGVRVADAAATALSPHG